MNNIKYCIFCCLIPVACSNGDFSFKEDQPVYQAPENVYNLIQEGDIVLRQGTGPFSADIVHFMNDKNKFSHCGIVVSIQDTLRVVHSISPELSAIDGMQTQSLHDFFTDVADSNAAVVRPLLSPEQKAKLVGEAKRYLDLQIPFDHEFNLHDSTKFSCNEMVYFSYKKATGLNPFKFKTNQNTSFIKFDSFFNPQFFSTVWTAKH